MNDVRIEAVLNAAAKDFGDFIRRLVEEEKISPDEVLVFLLGSTIGGLAEVISLGWSDDRLQAVTRAIVNKMIEEKANGKQWVP